MVYKRTFQSLDDQRCTSFAVFLREGGDYAFDRALLRIELV